MQPGHIWWAKPSHVSLPPYARSAFKGEVVSACAAKLRTLKPEGGNQSEGWFGARFFHL